MIPYAEKRAIKEYQSIESIAEKVLFITWSMENTSYQDLNDIKLEPDNTLVDYNITNFPLFNRNPITNWPLSGFLIDCGQCIYDELIKQDGDNVELCLSNYSCICGNAELLGVGTIPKDEIPVINDNLLEEFDEINNNIKKNHYNNSVTIDMNGYESLDTDYNDDEGLIDIPSYDDGDEVELELFYLKLDPKLTNGVYQLDVYVILNDEYKTEKSIIVSSNKYDLSSLYNRLGEAIFRESRKHLDKIIPNNYFFKLTISPLASINKSEIYDKGFKVSKVLKYDN